MTVVCGFLLVALIFKIMVCARRPLGERFALLILKRKAKESRGENASERHGVALLAVVLDPDFLDALIHLWMGLAGLTDAGDVALHIGEKHGDTEFREAFGEALEGDGLAGACRAGDESVSIGVACQEFYLSRR